MNRPLCRNHQYQILGLIVFALFWLSACGGGSGADGNPPAATVTGQALLGPLCGASVDVFRYDDLDNSIHTTTTTDAATLSAAGQFEIPEALLDDESLYIIKISGGMDIDADDDGVVDASPTENQGTLHLAATGSQMKAGGFKANILTDIVYHKIAYLFLAKYPLETILAEMEQYARILLKSDVNGTGTIDGDDLLAWNPANDMARTTRSRSFLMDCTAAVHAKSTYSDALSHIYKGIVAGVDTLGNAVDLALDGNHLFVASLAAGLQILNISDPTLPVLVGEVDTPGSAIAVSLSGNYAFVADGHSGLQVIDVSSPVMPTITGTVDTEGPATAIAVAGDYAYLADDWHGLLVVDIRHKNSPVIVGEVTGTSSLTGLAIGNGYLYVANGANGLLVFDISDPRNPFQISSVNAFKRSTSIAVNGSHAFLIDEGYGIRVLDISNPAQPSGIAFVELPCVNSGPPIYPRDPFVSETNMYLPGGTCGIQVVDISDLNNVKATYNINTPSGAYGVASRNGYIYATDRLYGIQVIKSSESDDPNAGISAMVSKIDIPDLANKIILSDQHAIVSGYSSGLHLVDIQDPGDMALVATVDNYYGSYWSCSDVAKYGNYIYTDSSSNEQSIIDISDPTAPRFVNPYNEFRNMSGISDMVVSDDLLYVATDGFQIFELNEPGDPMPKGHLYSFDLKWFEARFLDIVGHYALAAGHFDGLKVIDLDGATHSPVVATFESDFDYGAIDIVDDIAYLSIGYSGMQILDVSDPLNPMSLATIDTPGHARDFALVGDFAYVADGDTGLVVIDIADPRNPFILSSIALAGSSSSASQVTVSGSYAILGGGVPDFQIIDISEPADPLLLGSLDTNGGVDAMCSTGDFIFLAGNFSSGREFQAFDLRDPENPAQIGNLELASMAEQMVLQGDIVYLAMGNDGIQVVDISDPTAPIKVGTCEVLGAASDIKIEGDTAYVANHEGGIQVVSILDPTSPVVTKTIAAPAMPNNVAVLDGYAYVTDWQYGLQVIDVGDPRYPRIKAGVHTPGKARGVALSGDHALIAEGDAPVQIIDVSDPVHPSLAGSIDLPGNIDNIVISGRYAYAAAKRAGLQVIDIEEPTTPRIVGTVATPGRAYGVAVRDGYVFVTGDGGVMAAYRAIPEH